MSKSTVKVISHYPVLTLSNVFAVGLQTKMMPLTNFKRFTTLSDTKLVIEEASVAQKPYIVLSLIKLFRLGTVL